jgi:glucose-6-phosphate 1-dehydrogenase
MLPFSVLLLFALTFSVASSQEGLAILVVGASGDLAKKKIYPSLLQLYKDGLLPDDTIIWGYARTAMAHVDLRKRLRPHLLVAVQNADSPLEITIVVDRFLEICFYTKGNSYGDISAYRNVVEQISEHERSFPTKIHHNRLFYLAIPPNVFGETGMVRFLLHISLERASSDTDLCLVLTHKKITSLPFLGIETHGHDDSRVDPPRH